jgi:hypothetical protein
LRAAGLEHALKPSDVEHLGAEGDGARFVEPRCAVFLGETEQRVDAAHPGPGQRPIQERRSESPNSHAVFGCLPTEEVNVA